MDRINRVFLNVQILSFAVFNLSFSVAMLIHDVFVRHPDPLINFISRMSMNNIFFSKILQVLPPSTYYATPKIHDQTPYFTFELNLNAINAIEKSTDICISRTPTFSGTTSVVYFGVLNPHDKPKPVIIKIKKKGLKLTLQISYIMVKLMCFIIDTMNMLPSIKLCEVISIIYENVAYQNDFINEVNNLEHFERIFSQDNSIVIPRPYRHFTDLRSDVIVMDYIVCEDVETLDRDQKQEFCRLLSNFNLRCILDFSMFHCDIHSGNIKFQNSAKGLKLVVLDYGIIGFVSSTETQCICNLFRAAMTRSLSNVSRCIATDYLLNISAANNQLDDDIIENDMLFCDELECYLKRMDLNTLNMRDYLCLSEFLAKHGYNLKSCFSRLYLSLIVTHTFCSDTLKAEHISQITKKTVANIILQNHIKKFIKSD